jgi:hypothetical protein
LIFKYQEKKNLLPVHSEQTKITCELLNKKSLASFTTNFAVISVIVVLTATTDRVGRLDKHRLESVSEYVWIYVFTMIDPTLTQALSVVVLLRRSQGSILQNSILAIKDAHPQILDKVPPKTIYTILFEYYRQ